MKLIENKIYVTKGGTLLTEDGAEHPWGYDRVRFIKYSDETLDILVETPWGSLCELPYNYPLEETFETEVFSEFPLYGVFLEHKIISFSDALYHGICKQRKPSQIEKPVPIQTNNVSEEAVIIYFSTPKLIADCASHFGVRYQRIRYIIKQLINKGYGGQKYELKQLSGSNAVQLMKV